MSATVMLAVLFAAALHATWNARLKASRDPLLEAMAVVMGAGLLALPAVAWLPAPQAESWPPLAGSTALHVAYFVLVALAYRSGELSIAYPLMRGMPPVVIAAGAALFFGEALSWLGWTAVLTIVLGVLTLTSEGLRVRALSGPGLAIVAANVAVIAAYTLVDGAGVRASGNAASYAAWLFVLTGAALAPMCAALAWRRRPARPALQWGQALLGSACTLGAYGIALWAMTRAPIALVAALRETSILFGAAMAARWLREPFSRRRWAGVALVAAGAITMRIA
ncbi:MAG: EamA family transporter [Azospira oryzae]|uniref:EamA family transporter n=1 Tax=Pelomicrobium methylotrophicum TaxID=2602750 RepID=A0A5C7EIB1_9PROT|nr:DMT family transporter [Pelomicrobium methylotrophicum]PZP64943.1 MAG: EamA family transporter [Azospira oryzae]PZP82923.1 MAG: EamA family transporter [Azospira oryzae]TXF10600.1 EamA family transporter [Pelomicrobium methylotrophicum]